MHSPFSSNLQQLTLRFKGTTYLFMRSKMRYVNPLAAKLPSSRTDPTPNLGPTRTPLPLIRTDFPLVAASDIMPLSLLRLDTKGITRRSCVHPFPTIATPAAEGRETTAQCCISQGIARMFRLS